MSTTTTPPSSTLLCAQVWKGVLTELAKTKEEHSSKGTEFVGVTESLQVKLSELEALRAASMGELSQQLKAQNEATEALRAHADLGLLNVRNDTQRTVERNVSVLYAMSPCGSLLFVFRLSFFACFRCFLHARHHTPKTLLLRGLLYS